MSIIKGNIIQATTDTCSGGAVVVGKAILLDDIIDNLKVDSNYYMKANLTITILERQHKELYQKYIQKESSNNNQQWRRTLSGQLLGYISIYGNE